MTDHPRSDKRYLTRLSYGLWAALGKYAKAHDVSMNHIVNEALKRFFKEKRVKVEK
jgi:predicted HicB family RNase H-like nuclease